MKEKRIYDIIKETQDKAGFAVAVIIVQNCILPYVMNHELLTAWLETASTEEIKARLVELYAQWMIQHNQAVEAIGQRWGMR